MEGDNIREPVMELKHADLKRSDHSQYRSACPACRIGILPVTRDPSTFKLQDIDHCLYCGQQVKYLDIDELNDACG